MKKIAKFLLALVALALGLSFNIPAFYASWEEKKSKQCKERLEAQYAYWMKRFENKDLNDRITEVANGQNDSIDAYEEIYQAFKGTKYWEIPKKADDRHPYVEWHGIMSPMVKSNGWLEKRRDDEDSVDICTGYEILHANRGFLYCGGLGVQPSYMYDKDGEVRREVIYEYLDTIRRLLYEQGAYRRLYVVGNRYIWEDGGLEDPQTYNFSSQRNQAFYATRAWLDDPIVKFDHYKYEPKY